MPHRVRGALLAATLLAVAACASAPRSTATTAPAASGAPAVTDGRELVRRMREHYAGRWYRSLVFRQLNTAYSATGAEEKSEWMEYQRVPGRLRIDFLPLAGKNGIIFRDDQQFTFTAGKQTSARPLVHGLLVLSADLYADPVETTLGKLEKLGFDLARVHTAVLDGRPAYVVGAAPGDTATAQFWVDAERMLLVRLVEPRRTRDGRTTLSDIRITSYATVDGRPTPRVIVFNSDGRPVWREEYVDVKVDAPVPDDLFDPARFAETQRPAATAGQ
jgi:hypothetical protein